MKKRILVLGRTGMLGHMLMKVLSQEDGWDVCGTQMSDSGEELYFRIEEGVQGLHRIFELKGGFDYLINAVGMLAKNIDPDSSESVQKAILINALFPHQLSAFSQAHSADVIQISTDGVFSGLSSKPYHEGSLCDSPDIYGRTKSLGEVNARHFLNIRCSIIGPSPFEKNGLWEWFAAQPDNGEVSGFTNHFWQGVTTLQFAQLCRNIIKNEMFDILRNESGVFHFAPNEAVSKFELLSCLKSGMQKKTEIHPAEKGGSVKRLLATQFNGIKAAFPHPASLKEAVGEMIDFSKVQV